MKMRGRYLISVLLITLSFEAFQGALYAQDTPEPEVTEDPCPAIIEAGMQPQDNTEPIATEDPALASCLESLSITALDAATMSILAINEAEPDATEIVSPAIEEPGFVFIPISIIHSNSVADAGRVWVIWHDASTDALKVSLRAYNERLSYYNMGLDITIPDDVVNIAIRIETTQDRSSDNWEFDSTCAFAFTEPPESFSVTVDNDNICTGQIDSD